MSDEPDRIEPEDGSPPWPVVDVDGRLVVTFGKVGVGKARELIAELERATLGALGYVRKGDTAMAATMMQAVRSRLARWAGELAALEERLGGPAGD